MYVVNTKTYAKIARFIERSLLSDKEFKITKCKRARNVAVVIVIGRIGRAYAGGLWM